MRDYGRKRGPRRPPGPGWTIAELEEFAQVSRRTVAAYVRRGLLSQPEFRGTATRYQRHHLLRLLAIRLMKAEGNGRIKAIQRRLQTMGDQQLEAWVLSRPLPPAAAKALEQSKAQATNANRAATVSAVSTAGSTRQSPSVPTQLLPTQSWERAVLMPGIELTWRKDAGPIVDRVAKRFAAQLLELVNEASEGEG